MQRKFYFLLLVSLVFVSTSSGQSLKRAIAILDLSERNEESNEARLISSRHLIDVVGISYIITSDINEASTYSMIFCTSLLGKSTFTIDEEVFLENYVENGGTLVAPRLENERLFILFGVDGYVSSKSRHEIVWDSTLVSPALQWIDEPEERTISLGSTNNDEIFKTLGYHVVEAESLAYFGDGSTSVTRNAYGSGYAVTIGLSWKDVILRNQINRDFEAQRNKSNGFEPTTDVFMLFIRGLFLDINPYAVWKNTSPGNSKSTLMITHDVDSKSGVDSLHLFVDYEQENKIEATYNITVKYFEDALSSGFYNNNQEEFEYIIDNGHKIQSHSVGHFFDFADQDIIQKGESGNTKENYAPYNDGKATSGATVYGECEVSKNELEKDFNINVRSFRAGHLAYPNDLIEVLEELGYEYNSSYAARDVLTNFPYQNVIGRSFSQRLSSIYELPVTISDVFHEDPISSSNFLEKTDIWVETTRKNTANGAPSVLLIHPNRQYKLEAMATYLDSLEGQEIQIMEIGSYGDFWKARKSLIFNSELVDNRLVISVDGEQKLEDNISFIVNNGQDLSEIIVQDDLGTKLNFDQKDWKSNDKILFIASVSAGSNSTMINSTKLRIYPQPAQSNFTIEFELEAAANIRLNIRDLFGKKVMLEKSANAQAGKNESMINLNTESIAPGTYFISIESKNGILQTEKIIVI